jgi:hypothetical protein
VVDDELEDLEILGINGLDAAAVGTALCRGQALGDGGVLGRECYRGRMYGNSVYALRAWSRADNCFSIIRLISNMSDWE